MFFIVLPGRLLAGELADRKLLEILQSKGFLNPGEVEAVVEILDSETARQEVRQQELLQKLERGVDISFDQGLLIRTRSGPAFSARIGGVVQADFTMFDGHYPLDSDFDIRRARLGMSGRLYEDFTYKLEVELEGSSSNRLVDAYLDYHPVPWLGVRVGQFKTPFSLEHLISDRYLAYNERSMAYSLTPARDVGLMVHGSLLRERVVYALGVFNGDGSDAERRSQKDDKQFCGRLVLRPFYRMGIPLLDGLQVGGSYGFARLDTSDFSLKVRTPARTTLFTVQARAKFHMTQEVDDLERYGFELAYRLGPVLLTAEYIRAKYSGVKLSDTAPFDFDLRAWYVGMLIMLTGEEHVISGGLVQKVRPRKAFSLRRRTWGAWGIALRYQDFEAGRVVYHSLVLKGFSVRKANCFTVGLNWYLNDLMRVTIDYSRTRFDSPLYLGTHWKGYSYYEDIEHALVSRVQVEF